MAHSVHLDEGCSYESKWLSQEWSHQGSDQHNGNVILSAL